MWHDFDSCDINYTLILRVDGDDPRLFVSRIDNQLDLKTCFDQRLVRYHATGSISKPKKQKQSSLFDNFHSFFHSFFSFPFPFFLFSSFYIFTFVRAIVSQEAGKFQAGITFSLFAAVFSPRAPTLRLTARWLILLPHPVGSVTPR